MKWMHLRWTVTVKYNIVNRTNHSPAPKRYHTIKMRCDIPLRRDPTMTDKRAVGRMNLVTIAESCAQPEYSFFRWDAVFFRSNVLFKTDLRLNILFKIVIDGVYYSTGLDISYSERAFQISDNSHLDLTEVTHFDH